MGKESRKKIGDGKKTSCKKQTPPNVSRSSVNSPVPDNDTRPSLSPSCEPSSASHSGGGGIYETYKKCTNAVFEWAILSGEGTKNTSDTNISMPRKKDVTTLPLCTIILHLHELAKRNAVMPSTIFRNLKTAIRLRRQVSVYYNCNLTVTGDKSFCEGHQWIIDQLVLVHDAFRNVACAFQNQQETVIVPIGIENMENRFAALATNCGDENSLEEVLDKDTTFIRIPTSQTNPPKEENVQEEGRHFAIACALLEVENLRGHIRNSWKDWVSKVSYDTPDTVVARGLLSATCITRHGILMAKSSIMGTCVEFDAFCDFDEILKNPQEHVGQSSKFKLRQIVILCGLVAKPEFNDQCGAVCSISVDCSRYGVRLGNGNVISVKHENLLLSDNLVVGLNQVYEAVSSFDFTTVPNVKQMPRYSECEVISACKSLVSASFKMENALQCRDRRALLQFMVKHCFPLWIAFGDYTGDFGAADSLFRVYLRDFLTQRTIQFHWALLLLCMTDCCFDCYCVNKHSHKMAMYSMDLLLRNVCDAKHYQMAIDAVESTKGGNSAGFQSHMKIIFDIRTLWIPISTFFPCISGDLLLQGLRLNLVAASFVPCHFWKPFISLLHIYSMLRHEGYIATIPEIEKTLIRLYRRQVFFRSGVPESDTESYVSSWQLSVGVNVLSARALRGDRVHKWAGLSKHAENCSGLHVTEMSRLLAIFELQDVRVHSDPSVCFDEIHDVVGDEFEAIFLAPLMRASVQMHRLERLLVTTCVGEPRAFCERWVHDYDSMLSRLDNIHAICFWTLALADGRSFKKAEIRRGLQMVADCFGEVFGQCVLDSSERMSCCIFKFNPNNHSVSSAH